jgi:hypothetical protein
VDFDRACRVRRRGVRWAAASRLVRLADIGLFGALCLFAGLLAGHRLHPLDPHRPSRCLHHHKPGARSQAGGDPGGADDMDSNASRAGEVERKVWRDNDFLLPGKLLKMSPLVDRQSVVSISRKWGQRRRVAAGIRATALLAERASQYLVIVSPSSLEQLRVPPHVPPPFRYSEQHPRHRAVCMGSLFGADLQPPVSGSGTLPLRDGLAG